MENDLCRRIIKRPFKLSLTVFLFLIFFENISHANSRQANECHNAKADTPLPLRVKAMQSDILNAAETGNIFNLQIVLEQSELWPIAKFGIKTSQTSNPVERWIEQSHGTQGAYILAQIEQILTMPAFKSPLVKGLDLYIWPYFANKDISQLCPNELVDLLKISTPKAALKMQNSGKYSGFQLAIGSDGSWHYFARKNIAVSPK